jgi:hypothetical protein
VIVEESDGFTVTVEAVVQPLAMMDASQFGSSEYVVATVPMFFTRKPSENDVEVPLLVAASVGVTVTAAGTGAVGRIGTVWTVFTQTFVPLTDRQPAMFAVAPPTTSPRTRTLNVSVPPLALSVRGPLSTAQLPAPLMHDTVYE